MMIMVVNIPEEYIVLIRKLISKKVYEDQSDFARKAFENLFMENADGIVSPALTVEDMVLMYKGQNRTREEHGKDGTRKL